jgi:hypothetical protein
VIVVCSDEKQILSSKVALTVVGRHNSVELARSLARDEAACEQELESPEAEGRADGAHMSLRRTGKGLSSNIVR